MTDRVRIALLILVLMVLVTAYFLTVNYLSSPCTEIGHYTNGAPIYDCSTDSGLTGGRVVGILRFVTR
jgi:hypothetical protein